MKKNTRRVIIKNNCFKITACLLIVCIGFLSPVAISQSPGGITSNNTLWLRSDNGVTTNASGAVTQWQEVSGANVTGNFTSQPLAGFPSQTQPTVINAGINFNPYIRFNGTNNSLQSFNSIPGTSLVSNSEVTVFQVLNLKSGTVWLKWETDGPGATARLGFEVYQGKFRFDFPKAVPLTAGMNVGTTPILNNHYLSTCFAEATLSTNRLNGATDNTLPIPGPGNFAASNAKVILGNDLYYNLPTRVDLAEVIIYSRNLAQAERNKVETYLAVKYGFTLDQSATYGNDYTASNGTVAWNRAANSGYANNITGIGRDDASGLLQKQSKSVNAAALLTLYNGNTGGVFPALNADNSSTFSADGSYLIIGDDGSGTTLSQCAANNRIIRIGRTWKAQNTGTGIADVTIAINAADLPAAANTLIVSQDPSFSSGVSMYPLASSGSQLYTAVTFNNNDYFTFGVDSLLVNVTTTAPDCSNQAGGQINTSISGSLQPYTYLWSPGAATTPGLANVQAGTYTLTVTHGGCEYTEDITLVLDDNLSLVTNAGSSICTGGSVSVNTTSNATGYSWLPATGVSDPLSPNPVLSPTTTTTYTVTATLGSCTASESFTITVVPPPNVNAGSDATIVAGQSVQLQGSGPQGTYLWTPPAGLSNPGALNPIASPATSTTYTLTISTNEGCTGSDDVIVKVEAPGPECGKPMNAITPNGDGINDKWLVSLNCPYTAKVAIYNRYGNKVFESANYQNDWQGTYKGKPVPDGTYYFIVELKQSNGRTVPLRGDLTILR